MILCCLKLLPIEPPFYEFVGNTQLMSVLLKDLYTRGSFIQQEEIGTPENIQIKDISVMRCPEIYDFSSNLYTQQAG